MPHTNKPTASRMVADAGTKAHGERRLRILRILAALVGAELTQELQKLQQKKSEHQDGSDEGLRARRIGAAQKAIAALCSMLLQGCDQTVSFAIFADVRDNVWWFITSNMVGCIGVAILLCMLRKPKPKKDAEAQTEPEIRSDESEDAYDTMLRQLADEGINALTSETLSDATPSSSHEGGEPDLAVEFEQFPELVQYAIEQRLSAGERQRLLEGWRAMRNSHADADIAE